MGYPSVWQHSLSGSLSNLTLDAGATANIILDEDDMVSDRDDALSTQQSIKAYVDNQISGASSSKSYSFRSPSGGSGTFYAAGFYRAPVADANLNQGGPTVTLGTANVAYAAHAFLVAGGAGTASGGAGVVQIRASGTSITDTGVRTAGDSQVIVADITTMALNQYSETSKKWIGQVVFTLENAAGGTQTTFAADFNYGYCKYEDFGNRNFTITDFECVGRAGANDTGFNILLLYHNPAGWTYSAAAFLPRPTVIRNMNTVYVTEKNLANDQQFAFKFDNLSTVVDGLNSEGVVVQIVTGAAAAVDNMSLHIRVDIT